MATGITPSTPLPGWLFCYGQAVSRSGYARLFGAIGTTYGVGDGVTTFNVPDLRGRLPVGLDNMGGTDAGRLAAANTLGGTGGAERVTLSATESGVQSHGHADSFSITHDHAGARGTVANAAGNAYLRATTIDTDGGAMIGNNSAAISGSVTAHAGAAAVDSHENMPPYILMNWIIKT